MTTMHGNGLGIAEVSARTGLGEPTLRMWESRYGFPDPERTPSGHRRYDDNDVMALNEVLKLRDEGMALKAAIERVRARTRDVEPSVFRLLSRRTGLPVQILRKRTLTAMSHAIEDECCRQGGEVVFVGAFQLQRHLESSLERWRDLSRTASACLAFVAWETAPPPRRELPGGPAIAFIADSDDLVREWFIAGWGPEAAICLSAWERPGNRRFPDGERQFECLWTVDREVVREAIEWCALRAEGQVPDAATALRAALGPTGRGTDDLTLIQAVAARMVSYVAERQR